MKTNKINNIIIVSDLHCGCQLGLCPTKAKFDDGGYYIPNKLQKKVWNWWQEFWYEWVPLVCRKEPFMVVNNGDSIDGVHHGAKTQVSQNLTDQKAIAYEVLKPIVELCEGRYYHVRGTEAHVGKSGEEEESLAKMLGAVPDDEGRFARWELWVKLKTGLCHIMHHIGVSGSLGYETSAVQKELEQSFVEAARWREEPPAVIARSHRHRNIETRIRTKGGFATAFTTAGWQLKTPFSHKVVGGRIARPQIGGSLIRCGDEDIYTRHQIWDVERPSPIQG